MSNEFTSSHLINQVLEYQQKVIDCLNHNIGEEYNDALILEYFTKAKEDWLFVNSAVAEKIADYCQLLDRKENFEQVSLEQLKEIYKSLLDIHPLDIGPYESLAFSLTNILDRPEEAKEGLRDGINIDEWKISELKSILKENEGEENETESE